MHRKVLLIDHVPDNAPRYQQMLAGISEMTYSIIPATSVGEGIALIEGERPDCALISWTLNGQGGAVALHRIRSRRPNMPLVMLTVSEPSFQLEEMQAVGECEVVNVGGGDLALHDAINRAIDAAEVRRTSARLAAPARTVLIVDDNPDDREFCMRALAQGEEHFQILEAESGPRGLAVIEEHMPACVLLDYSLPGQSGLDVLRRIQAIDSFLPVIMMTGHGDETIAVKALKGGAQNYLVKSSVTPQHLQRAVLSAVEHAELERQTTRQRQELYEQKLALAETSRLNIAILDTAPCLICATDMQGKVLVFNKELEHVLGYSASEVVGRHTPSLWSPRSPITARAKAAAAQGGVPPPLPERGAPLELTFIRKDGSEVPVSLWVRELHNSEGKAVGMLGLGVDITERKRQLEALKMSEELFRSILEHAPLGMAMIDPTGRFLKVNLALCQILGCTDGQLRETSLQAVIHPDDQEVDADRLGQLQAGLIPSYTVEKRVLGEAGQAIEVQINLSLVRGDDGRPQYYIVQMQDIRERKQVERLKGEFIAVFSHELRTPLTSIRGSLGLLSRATVHDNPEQTERLIGIAQRNCERLTLLINNILDADRLASGRMRFETRQAELSTVLREAMESNRGYAESFKVNLVLDPPGHDAVVTVDPVRLLQVLANLISNAVKFSPENGEVCLGAEVSEGEVRICVRDRGPGIADAARSRLFQRFSQVDSSSTRAVGGSGLGLFISKQLVEHMGGRIGVDTAEGQGSNFWVAFPGMDGAQAAVGERGTLTASISGSGDFISAKHS